MSAKDDEFRDYCLELLSSLRQGDIAAKKMFGGVSFSIDGKTFSIIAFDELWLKVDDESRAAFEKTKCRIFTYEGKDGVLRTMNYYTVPEEAMESAALMRPWAMLGWEAALRAAANKTKKSAKKATIKTTNKPAAKQPATKTSSTKTTTTAAKKSATKTKKK